MKTGEVHAVYLPHNEPYLGNEELLAFDKFIPIAMSINSIIAARSFSPNLSPLQLAAAEIIPQGISIALSIRELTRQAYLYPAGILVRPLIDRAGTMCWLQDRPEALESWHQGWPRKSQPSMEQMLAHMHPLNEGDFLMRFSRMLHKHVHADPEGAEYNRFEREDGSPIYPTGKIIDQPEVASFLSSMGRTYLHKLVLAGGKIFRTL